MELVIWKQISVGEFESPQGFRLYNVPEGWELIYETDEGQEITLHESYKEARKKAQEITLHESYKEARKKAQEIKGFKIPKHPKGQFGQWIKEPIAYCTYHHCFLSHTDTKNHKCMKKNCGRMVRVSSPHWDRRDELKRNKKRKKSDVSVE